MGQVIMLLKALATGLLMAFAEIINGNIRVRVLHRRFGKKSARIISFFSGVTIIYMICWFTLPWIAPGDYPDCFIVGFVWLSIMVCLDVIFGKYVFRLKWNKIAQDFNPMKGNLLGVGMGLLFFSPAIVFWLQR